MKKSFSSQFVHTFGISCLIAVIGILTSIITTRSLGPEGKGVYSIAIRAIGILIAFGQFGLPEVMLFQMRSDQRRPSAMAANSLVIILAGTALAATLLWVTYPFLENSFYRGVGDTVLWLAFLGLPFNLAFLFFGRMIHLDGRLGAYNLLRLISAGTGLVAISICLWINPGNPGAAILGLVISYFVLAICAVILVRRWIAPQNWRMELVLLRKSFWNGFKVQWGMFANILGQYAGIFILNYFLDLQDVGWFSTALGLATFVLLLSETARTVLQAWMPSHDNTSEEAAQRTLVTTRHTFLILLACAICLAIFGKPLILIMYGLEFISSYTPMLFLLPGLLAMGSGQVIASYLAFENRLELNSIAASLAVVTNILLASFFVPRVGMNGAAIAFCVGQLSSISFLLACFLKITGRHLREFKPELADLRSYVSLLLSIQSKVGNHKIWKP